MSYHIPIQKDINISYKQYIDLLNDQEKDFFQISIQKNPFIEDRLNLIFTHSPFLKNQILKFPQLFLSLMSSHEQKFKEHSLGETIALSLLEKLTNFDIHNAEMAELMKFLRILRAQIALCVAWGDLYEKWDVEKVTKYLSLFADQVTALTIDWILLNYHKQGIIHIPNLQKPSKGTHIIVLAVGKLGAMELNYSSDIDLILFYDERQILSPSPDDFKKIMIKLTQDLVKILQEQTIHGYVLRVDLRLRPDPGATAPIISIGSAIQYYSSVGQNWERAVLIRARQIAGDLVEGENLLNVLKSFIWRKNLDFNTIQDIHSIKRQINSHQRPTKDQLLGYNVKLGPGGIREIELFFQTQQLIYGGRNPSLQTRHTLKALHKLKKAHLISPKACSDLSKSYLFMRQIEHRLQMIEDHQTHSLPNSVEKFEEFAKFCDYDSGERLLRTIKHHIFVIQKNYTNLFKEAPDLSGPGNLVFTGADDDPGTIITLQNMGFKEPSTVISAIRTWHHGRYKSLKSARARQILTELVPSILISLSQTLYPQNAFIHFDKYLAELPYGFQIFSMIYNNPTLMDFIARVMGSSPELGRWLAQYPNLLENIINPYFYRKLKIDYLSLDENMPLAKTYEEKLDLCRRWANNHKFMAGVHQLFQFSSYLKCASFQSQIADYVLNFIFKIVQEDFEQRYGVFPSANIAVIAMGNLGGEQLTLASDLDLVFVYETNTENTQSLGDFPMSASEYYMKFTQRFITAITAFTNEGRLYEVDLRLRPSGNSGPIAVHFNGFVTYYSTQQAWVWEKMALTRARVIISSGHQFKMKVKKNIAHLLSQPYEPDYLKQEIVKMRHKVKEEFPGTSFYDLKYKPGGILDIEFLCQYLQLLNGPDFPYLFQQNTYSSIHVFYQNDLLEEHEYKILSGTYLLLCELLSFIRMSTKDENFFQKVPLPDEIFKAIFIFFQTKKMIPLPKNQKKALAKIEDYLGRTAQKVQKIYNKFLSI